MTKPIKGPLTILGLEVENFKRVSIVQLKPDGSLIEIAGDNGEGKSSLLDAIWAALGGAKSFPEQPIREGQQEANIELDLGEVKVVRHFRRKEGDPPYTTSLLIEAADGSTFAKPQTLMDSLVGTLSFEPMAFMELTDKEKFQALKAFVPDVDFDAIAGENETDFAKRTDENRREKDLRAQAAGIIIPPGEHKGVSVDALLSELEAGETVNRDIDRRRLNRRAAEENVKVARRAVESIERQIAELQADLVKNRGYIIDTEAKLTEAGELPEPIDTAAIRENLGNAQKINAWVMDAKRKAELTEKADQHKQASDALTEAMDARKEFVSSRIASAKMPIPGLALEAPDRVLLNGVDFDQGSTAEKLKTSIAVAMAMNPTIRVIRITKGGNDLDKKSMKVIADMAKEHGYQVWVERVEAAGKPSIIMENGHAKS